MKSNFNSPTGMSRVKINLPEEFIFKTNLSVSIADINYGNHMGNERALVFAHEARLQWLKSFGFSNEVNLANEIGIVVADAAIVYRAEAFHGDDLTIKLGVNEVTRHSFDLLYVIENENTGKEIARVKTGIVCMDYKTRKISSIPDKLREHLM